MKKITIGIADTASNYQNYPPWIKGNEERIEIVKLSPDNMDGLKKCDGVVLSGGIDSHPRYYNNDRLDYPNAPLEFNEQRDEFELEVFDYTQKNHIPVLAICRGMQLVNFALGGSIVQDLEESDKLNHRRQGDMDCIHEVTVEKESFLYEIIRQDKGIINSAHHQGLGDVADFLKVNAWSPDGVAEGVEWRHRGTKPFLLGVQWHPERLGLAYPDSPFSKNIREAFLQAILSDNKFKVQADLLRTQV